MFGFETKLMIMCYQVSSIITVRMLGSIGIHIYIYIYATTKIIFLNDAFWCIFLSDFDLKHF